MHRFVTSLSCAFIIVWVPGSVLLQHVGPVATYVYLFLVLTVAIVATPIYLVCWRQRGKWPSFFLAFSWTMSFVVATACFTGFFRASTVSWLLSAMGVGVLLVMLRLHDKLFAAPS